MASLIGTIVGMIGTFILGVSVGYGRGLSAHRDED